jgi:hypothetical protein
VQEMVEFLVDVWEQEGLYEIRWLRFSHQFFVVGSWFVFMFLGGSQTAHWKYMSDVEVTHGFFSLCYLPKQVDWFIRKRIGKMVLNGIAHQMLSWRIFALDVKILNSSSKLTLWAACVLYSFDLNQKEILGSFSISK